MYCIWQHTYASDDDEEINYLENTVDNDECNECPEIDVALVRVSVKTSDDSMPYTDTKVEYHTKQYVNILKTKNK